MEHKRTYRFYEWIGSHARMLAVGALLVALTLGVVGSLTANTNDADFEPAGEVFDTYEEASETLTSDSLIHTQTWIVEAATDGGNVVGQAALAEWLDLTRSVQADPVFSEHLVSQFDPDTGVTIPGIMSVADIADSFLGGTLATASDAEVSAALDAAFADESPVAQFRFSMSEQAELGDDGWFSPAFTAQVVYDSSGFDSIAAEEEWLRDLQTALRDGAVHTESIGITIDPELAFSEAGTQSAPFIFLAVALIIVLVAVVHRSFWSAVVVGSGLAATTLAAYGTSALIGLKMGSVLLALIVPIAMISFGVDFYIHGVGRVREAQVDHGYGAKRSYSFGMTAVFTAMLLAVMSSVSAFMANAASGTEAIIEFGIGSAIALVWAYAFLGQIAPRVTVGIEEYLGNDPVKRWSKVPYALGTVLTAVVGGLTVALAAIMPITGAPMLVIFVVGFVLLPIAATKRRNRKAAEAGRNLVHGHTGAAHGLASAGTVARFVARWRYVAIPVIVLAGALAWVQASTVESGMDIEDMISSETDFAQSIAKATDHFPSSGQGPSYVYVTGDLSDPTNLAALDRIVEDLEQSDADMGRYADGGLIVGLHAGDVVRMVMASPAVADIEAVGPSLADVDADGLPDSKAAIESVLRHALESGVLTPEGDEAIPVSDVPTIVASHTNGYATAVTISVGSWTDGEIIVPVEEALLEAAAVYEASTDGMTARVSGDVVANHHGMNAFTRSMVVSLPLAALLALIISTVMLRSFRYALVSVLPIGLVVVGIYAFMATFGYTVNVVTATIAAVAVGVGIDFSTHFTARFREELGRPGSKLDAVQRAGAGTGGALVLSALTSVMGFLVMSLAPMPMFATFGVLTAVMIVESLLVAVLVLPALLVLVTPSRVRAEGEPPTEPVRRTVAASSS